MELVTRGLSQTAGFTIDDAVRPEHAARAQRDTDSELRRSQNCRRDVKGVRVADPEVDADRAEKTGRASHRERLPTGTGKPPLKRSASAVSTINGRPSLTSA